MTGDHPEQDDRDPMVDLKWADFDNPEWPEPDCEYCGDSGYLTVLLAGRGVGSKRCDRCFKGNPR